MKTFNKTAVLFILNWFEKNRNLCQHDLELIIQRLNDLKIYHCFVEMEASDGFSIECRSEHLFLDNVKIKYSKHSDFITYEWIYSSYLTEELN